MKPDGKQIDDLQKKISAAIVVRELTYAEVSRIADVNQAQVSRICRGQFKTFSNNVAQICKALDVKIPQLFYEEAANTKWKRANASMRRLCKQSPDGAAIVVRVLDAIADLQSSARLEASEQAAGAGIRAADSRE